MKRFLFLIFIFSNLSGIAQDSTIFHAFDFWVGEWEVRWNGPDGKEIIGHNSVTKDLDNKVIREQFSDPSTGLLGTSISVFSPGDSLWHQAWADNSGGYLDLVGIVEDDIRVFQTKPITSDEQTVIRRMLFYNILPDSFLWDWEISTDGGDTWKLAWQIKYIRIK